MSKKSPELKVVSCNSRGRRRYDKASKRALVEACLRPGVSIARQAQENGVNANLLRKWIAQYLLERERAISAAASIEAVAAEANADLPDMPEAPAHPMSEAQRPAFGIRASTFVAVVQAPTATQASLVESTSPCMALALHVRLANGVELDLGKANLEELTTIVQMLGRMPCSGSTTV